MHEGDDVASDSTLDALAAAVLAGRPVDWDEAEARVPPPRRGLVRQLRALAGVAGFYRRLQGSGDHAPVFAVGTMWAHLRLERFLAAGAFGEVHVARDTRLDRLVALKLLRAADLPSTHDASAVLAEARRLARVRHPHVVTVHGAEHVGEHVGLWMELVPGESLADLVARQGPLPESDVLRIARDLAGALAAVHGAGLVHGDVKAQNVMREDTGRVVLMDFGAGTDLWSPQGASSPSALTPAYAAPELLRGAPATPASDLFSLGVLLHLLATGSHPRPLPARRPAGLPPRLWAAVTWLMHPDPGQRPSSADAFARTLAPRRSRRPEWLAAAVLLSVMAAGLAWLQVRRSDRPGGPGAPRLPAVQRVPLQAYRVVGRPARDVALLPYADVAGNVALLDLETFASREVVRADGARVAEFTALSADGTQVAYQWQQGEAYELRVANVSSGRSHVVLPAGDATYPVPVDWSRDGSTLLVLSRQPDGVRQLVVVPATGGTVRVLRRFPRAMPFSASLSPDGRHVAFDHRDDEPRERDVAVIEVASGRSWPLADHDAWDAHPAWTPDGRGVLFQSARAGSVDAWLQPVRGGRPTGEPRVVARHLGRTTALGFSGDSFYFLAQTSVINAMVAPLDPRTRRVGAPSPVAPGDEGASAQPTWSPDGRRLAYLALRGPRGERGGHVVVVRDMTSGASREYGQQLGLFLPNLSWSPDGTRLLVRGTDARNQTGLHVIELASGQVRAALPGTITPPGPYGWSRDGRQVQVAAGERGVLAIDLTTGAMTERLAATDAGVRAVLRAAESTKGDALAFSGRLTDGTSVLRVSEPAGRITELARGEPGESLVVQAWSPDDRHVLFTRVQRSRAEPHALWQASRDGRERVSLGHAIAGWTQANPVSLRPDGQALAYTSGDASFELSRLVHFLSPPADPRRF